jgi:hypothetical protein
VNWWSCHGYTDLLASLSQGVRGHSTYQVHWP